MARPPLDRTRVADVLVDARLLGAPKAAERWGCSDRTIRNYQQLLATDAELARLYALRLRQAEEDWRTERLTFLRKGLQKLNDLVSKANKPDHIHAVANAVKVVGELQVAADVLGGGNDDHPANPGAPAAAGSAEAGEAEPH